MAGKPNKGNKRLKDYGKVLMAKQLLRAIYNNPREKIFKRFFGKKMEIPIKGIHNVVGDPETKDGNPKNTVPTINKVFTSLSSRLEIVLTAMGGALSFQHARQLINHGKVSVNGYTIKQRHYLLKDGDIIISKAGLTHSGSLGFTESTSPSNHSSSFSQPNLRSKEDSQRLGFGVQLEKKIGGMKVAKLPGYLKIKTPVAATLLINSDLNLGIYYSKPLFTSFTQRETAPEEFTSFASSYAWGEVVSGGWKNLSVKELKLLLAPVTSPSQGSDNLKEKEEGDFVQFSLSKVEQVKWESLYSLVQAYYLRK